jgi:hypothetical protein
VALDGNGVGTYTVTSLGIITAQAFAIDVNGNSSNASTTVNTIDRTDLEAPTVALDLSGIVAWNDSDRADIHGTAVDNNRSANFGTKVFVPTYVLKLA